MQQPRDRQIPPKLGNQIPESHEPYPTSGIVVDGGITTLT